MERKRILQFLLGALILLAAGAPFAASSAETYMITSYTIDGGGAQYSDNERFALGGTIGQPDATVLQGDDRFELVGGFWGVSLLNDENIFLPVVNKQ